MMNFRYVFFYFAVIICLLLAGSWCQDTVRADSSSAGTTHAETDPQSQEESESPAPGAVEITPKRQQLIGLKVAAVEKKSVVHTIRILGRVAADETRIYRINSFIDGWIQEAPYNTVGSFVKKGEVLATFYSPQFLDAEQAYIYALGAVDRLQLGKRLELGRKELPAQIALDQLTVQRQIDNLRGMGMGDAQIEEIGRTRKITQNIRITAPAHGFISARNVSRGQSFSKGTELYRIEDLSHVWILADVYEQEVQYFKAGEKARASIPYQKKTYHATVSDVLPVFDPDTQTLKVRLETDNPGFVLRPDMFVDVELPVSLPPAITVPTDAVLHSGLRKTVFVDKGNGFFEPRQVETGWRMGDRIEVVHGLREGERVVVSGNFFVDSESRLQAAGLGIYGAMSIDAVCGMEVDEARAKAIGMTSMYQGKTYYFCAEECKEQFDQNPGQFAGKPSEEPDSSMHKAHPGTGHD